MSLSHSRRDQIWLDVRLLGVGAMWSFSGVLIKLLHASGVDLFFIAAVRSLIGVLALCLFVPPRTMVAPLLNLGRGGKQEREWRRWQLTSALTASFNTILLVWVFVHTTATTAILLHSAGGIILVAVFSGRLLGESPSRLDWAAVFVHVCGVLLLFWHGLANHEAWAVVAGGLCGLSSALTQVNLRRLSRAGDPAQGKSLSFEASGFGQLLVIVTSFVLFATGDGHAPSTVTSWGQIFAIGIVAWALPNLIYLQALRSQQLLRTLLATTLNLGLTGLWPILLGLESPDGTTLTGAALIVAALLMKLLQPSSKKP